MIKIESVADYTVVRIPVASLYDAFVGQDKIIRELTDWCLANFGEPGIWGGPLNGFSWKQMSNSFYFERMEDAILLKMTWEGVIPDFETKEY